MQNTIGELRSVAFGFAPKEHIFCSGQSLNISDQTALFSLLGTQYGGDGRSVFSVPDLRARVMVGSADMGVPEQGLQSLARGAQQGAQQLTLTPAQLPDHSHILEVTATAAQFLVTTEDGTHALPAEGDYLAQPRDLPGLDTREHIFKADPSPESLVPLSGLQPGEIQAQINPQTSSDPQSISLLNPSTAVNHTLVCHGSYPSRSMGD